MRTIDHSRQGKRSRRKGANGELEVRDLLRAAGWERAHRNFMSGGAGGNDLADAIPDVAIEVKRTEVLHLGAAWRQANASARPTDTVIVAHRGNGQPWMASLLLTDVMDLTPAPPFAPKVIGERASVRAEFMAEHRGMTNVRRPMVVHQVGSHAMATVLLEDLLGWWPR